MKKHVLIIGFLIGIFGAQILTSQSKFTIDVTKDNHFISPYIYGLAYKDYPYAQAKTLNGQRMTGFNWENNASADSYAKTDLDTIAYHLDSWLPGILGVNKKKLKQPGAVLKSFYNDCMLNNQMPVMTLQMAGYVAADTICGDVLPAPSSCWKKVINRNPNKNVFPPDTTDDIIYIDGCLNFIRDSLLLDETLHGYFLDNEPEFWYATHKPIVNATDSNNISIKGLLTKTIDLAKTIRASDSNALIFGPGISGYAAYDNLLFSTDYLDVTNDGFETFTDYYLDALKKEQLKSNIKMLDVFDFHWYSYADGVFDGYTTEDAVNNRLQSPRTFWDTTYVEQGAYSSYGQMSMLRRLKRLMIKHELDVKIAVSEYFFGAPYHVSGGIAQADALGVFCREDVYFASLYPNWGSFDDPLDGYPLVAFNLYRNYDGKGSEFGSKYVFSETKDTMTSVYASIDSASDKLHIIVINKDQNNSKIVDIVSNFITVNKEIKVFWFDENEEGIQDKRFSVTNINNFEFEMPALSVSHLILGDIDDSNQNVKKYENNILIYPNPASDYIRLVNKTNESINRILLCDLNDNVMIELQSEFDNFKTEDLLAGVYYLRIYINNQIVIKPVIIF